MTIAETLEGDVTTLLDSLASGVDPRRCVATFDLRLGLVVGETVVSTIQSHVRGQGVSWTREDCAEPEIIARVDIADLGALLPGRGHPEATTFEVVGAHGSELPPFDVLRAVEALVDESLSAVELVIDIEVTETLTGTQSIRLEVSRGTIRRSIHHRTDWPTVSFSLPWTAWERWRLGRASLLDVLAEGAQVRGHWTELLCAHGLSQLRSVSSALRSTPPVPPAVLLWAMSLCAPPR